MGSVSSWASGLAILLLPATGHAVDCSPFRPDAPVEQLTETEIKAEVGGLLTRLFEAGGEYRLADAQKALGANAKDPDGLMRWQSKLYYFCEAMNEDQTISTRDRIEIMRGIMDTSSDAQLNKAIENDIQKSNIVDGTGMTLEACEINNRVLICDFLVETAETSKQVDIYAGNSSNASRLIDNQGNTYIANMIDFGGKESAKYVKTDLPPDVPMRGRLTFDNISNRATSAAILEIRGRLDNKDIAAYEFRDFSFE